MTKLCRRAQEGVSVGRVWFRTADQLSNVSDLSVQEIKCMLYDLAQQKLYIHFIIYHVIEEWEWYTAGSGILKIRAFSET